MRRALLAAFTVFALAGAAAAAEDDFALQKAYNDRLLAMDDSAPAHVELAKWCEQQGLADRALVHWQEALFRDPTNAEAKRALGLDSPVAAVLPPKPNATPAKSSGKVSHLPRPKAQVRIGTPIDPNIHDKEWEDTILTLAQDMVAIFETKVAPEPPTGRKPFYIVQSTDGMPRANYGGDRHNVIITMLAGGGWHTQATFQLGHEIGHFWTGESPGWWIESFCTGLGFMCIDELQKQWKLHPKGEKWAGWAENMKNYHDGIIRQSLNDIGLANMDEAFEWARTKVPALLREGKFDRKEEQALAAVIEQVMRRHPGQWAALTRAHEVGGSGPLPDFEKWHSIVTPAQRPLVKDLAAAMGAPIRTIGTRRMPITN